VEGLISYLMRASKEKNHVYDLLGFGLLTEEDAEVSTEQLVSSI
jgi:hypothetical protein